MSMSMSMSMSIYVYEKSLCPMSVTQSIHLYNDDPLRQRRPHTRTSQVTKVTHTQTLLHSKAGRAGRISLRGGRRRARLLTRVLVLRNSARISPLLSESCNSLRPASELHVTVLVLSIRPSRDARGEDARRLRRPGQPPPRAGPPLLRAAGPGCVGEPL